MKTAAKDQEKVDKLKAAECALRDAEATLLEALAQVRDAMEWCKQVEGVVKR